MPSPDLVNEVTQPASSVHVGETLPLDVLALVLSRSRLLGRWALVGAIAGFLLAVASGGQYVARAILMPQSNPFGVGSLAGLAAQVGITAGTSGGGSPRYYQELLQSDAVLLPVLGMTFRFAKPGLFGLWQGDTISVPLWCYFGAEDSDSLVAIARARRRFDETIGVTTSRESGLVVLSVNTGSAELSRDVAHALVQRLQELDRAVRREAARSDASFADERAEHSQAVLMALEDSLGTFLTSNREFRSSPSLVFEYERRHRAVQQQQQVVSYLVQVREQALIEAARNTPLASVIQSPVLPQLALRRGILTKTLGGALLGFGAAAGAIALLGVLGFFSIAGSVEENNLRMGWAGVTSRFRRKVK